MSFSYEKAIKFGWETFWKNFLLFVGIWLVILAVMMVAAFFQDAAMRDSGMFAALLMVALWALNIIIGMGFIKIMLLLHDKKKAQLKDLFSQYRLFFYYLGGVLLYSLIVLGGLILFVIPGIVWAITYQYVPYLIIDRKLSPLEALKKSREITRGNRWELFGFRLILLLINLLGVLVFFVGQLVTGPLTMLAQVHVYRVLLKSGGKAAAR